MENSFSKELAEILPLVTAVEIRDAYTQGHSQRVANYALYLAQALGLNKKEQKRIFLAGLLHDIGKIGIPDSVLLKPGSLTPQEYELIKLHSPLSAKIVEKIPHYQDLTFIVETHHEDYNGRGYPHGLSGEDIPLEARILSIADVYDALTTKRVYRGSSNLEKTIEIMDSMQKQQKFDPALYDLFKANASKLLNLSMETSELIIYPSLEELRRQFFFLDPLTKCLNRQGFLAILRKSSETELYAILGEINIENFKAYNKLYGLQKGDLLLQKLAQFLQKELKAITTLQEPKLYDLFLARIHADRFLFLYLSNRKSYIEHHLLKLSAIFKEKEGITFYMKFYLDGKPLPKNIDTLGYLL